MQKKIKLDHVVARKPDFASRLTRNLFGKRYLADRQARSIKQANEAAMRRKLKREDRSANNYHWRRKYPQWLLMSGNRIVARVMLDGTYPNMYRVYCGDFVSDIVNLTRAKEAALHFNT